MEVSDDEGGRRWRRPGRRNRSDLRRRDGLPGACARGQRGMPRAASLIPRLVVSRFYEHRLDRIPDINPRVACGLRPLVLDDVELFAHVRPMSPEKTEQFRRRLLDGDECFGGFVDDRLATYDWVQWKGVHSLQEEGLRARCPVGTFWLYDGRTADALRGLHLHPFLQAHILGRMRDRGFERCLVYTGSGNTASQKGMARAGFRFVRYLYAVRWLDRSFPLPKVWLRKSVVEFRHDGTCR